MVMQEQRYRASSRHMLTCIRLDVVNKMMKASTPFGHILFLSRFKNNSTYRLTCTLNVTLDLYSEKCTISISPFIQNIFSQRKIECGQSVTQWCRDEKGNGVLAPNPKWNDEILHLGQCCDHKRINMTHSMRLFWYGWKLPKENLAHWIVQGSEVYIDCKQC